MVEMEKQIISVRISNTTHTHVPITKNDMFTDKDSPIGNRRNN